MGEATKTSTESLIRSAQEAVSVGTEALRRCITRVAKQLDDAEDNGEKYNDKLGSHLAYLSEPAARNLVALRQLEAHEKKMAEEMSPEDQDAMIAEYIRDLPRDRLAPIRAALADRDAEGSVL